MNYLWAGMILVGLLYASFAGTMPLMANAAIEAANEAVTLSITMVGVMSFWMGLMKIAECAGMIEGLSRKMKPILQFLFPNLPKEDVANEYIATNMIANIFGLGWAATPAGLKAMEALQERNLRECELYGESAKRSPCTASEEMCTFLIINISSLQLIPMNVIAYRNQYGSVDPTAVVGPALLATMCSTGAAIIFCKIMHRKILPK